MTITDLLLAVIDEAYDKRSWHGTNLRGSLRGVTLEQASWRPRCAMLTAGNPSSERHNIWELMVHAAYWKYDIRRRLKGDDGRSFAIKGSNFWTRPANGTLAEWKNDLALLESEHVALRKAVENFPQKKWTLKAPGKPFKFEGLVRGVAAHDVYHAGQIQLLKKLMCEVESLRFKVLS